ncbi:MAG: cytoplasmic protein [Proteobacteria bacterium]|nr:cytoplasmic protein [Pseudomonadota bacterium]
MNRMENAGGNPLRLLSEKAGLVLGAGEMGAVLARAGVGKTAVLVQIALSHLLSGKNVLHVSLDQPVKKVCLWYDEVYNHVAGPVGTGSSVDPWETILPNRFVMAFQAQGFSAAVLEERITDLTEQGIFYPQVVLVDGMLVDEAAREALTDLARVARENRLSMWLSVRITADGENGGPPQPFDRVADLFSTAILLTPGEGKIRLTPVLGPGMGDPARELALDPSSLLIVENGQP